MRKILLFLSLLFFSSSVFAFQFSSQCQNKKITIFTKPNCPYCIKLKSVLEKIGVNYVNYDISKNRILGSWLISSTRANTVPYVFLEDEYIGGYIDFMKDCIKL